MMATSRDDRLREQYRHLLHHFPTSFSSSSSSSAPQHRDPETGAGPGASSSPATSSTQQTYSNIHTSSLSLSLSLSSSSSSSSAPLLDALRRHLLLDGLPSDANALGTSVFGRCSLRGLVWKALLNVGHIDTDEYILLVRRGPSSSDSRVREDARRTFTKNDDFTTRVPTSKLIRLLNAYVMDRGNERGVYAQSMSLLAAPFLYVMPEPDAFHCFRALLSPCSPVRAYVERYDGATRACHLLDKCVMHTLPELHDILRRHGLDAQVYAFPVVSSLGMCVRPLFDTVRLWDIVLAFGIHMHIVFTLARLALRQSTIVAEAGKSRKAPLATRELEQGFGLDAETVLAKGVALTKQLDPALYAELVDHASATSTASPALGSTPTPTSTSTSTPVAVAVAASSLRPPSLAHAEAEHHPAAAEEVMGRQQDSDARRASTGAAAATTADRQAFDLDANWNRELDLDVGLDADKRVWDDRDHAKGNTTTTVTKRKAKQKGKQYDISRHNAAPRQYSRDDVDDDDDDDDKWIEQRLNNLRVDDNSSTMQPHRQSPARVPPPAPPPPLQGVEFDVDSRCP